MRILTLGTGLQGKAALYDLARSQDVTRVLAADADILDLRRFATTLGTNKIDCFEIDAAILAQVSGLMKQVQAVITLLPPSFGDLLAPLAVESGVHWVDASYARPIYHELHGLALANDVALLPEFGLDPGIDLLLAAQALTEMDTLQEFYSYGAGIPEPRAADNPLSYRISWSFSGVLGSYVRPARLLRDGQVVDIPPDELFAPGNIHAVDIPEVGRLEAYPNGDALTYVESLGLKDISAAGRYSLRWPGHASFWYPLIKLGFLEDERLAIGESHASPRQIVQALLEPQLQYGPDQRDIALVQVELVGLRAGRRCRLIYRLVDHRDLDSGLLAMQRTVGFAASIGAQMILRGQITGRGLLSPIKDVPPRPMLNELARRGVLVQRELQELPD